MRCDPTLLWTLVEQSAEPGDEVSGLLEHVERCSQCQSTLRSIGGNESWWNDVRTWLGGGPESAAPQTHHNGLSDCTPIDVAALAPSHHPEMLGRLGRYDIEGVIGRGGMGVVFRGFDSDLQRCVAIKILSLRYEHDLVARERFAREAQAAASVVHENVIPIFNVEAEHNPPFLVMPYVAGATLERYIQRYGPPDAITVLRIASQIASGLQAAHRLDLIHRDIKPGNILVTENVHRVWITDFGLARAIDNATLTHTGLIAGTPQYMSPEQSRGQRLDARSDLFSFGSLLYFLSTGEPPFQGDSTLAVLHGVATADPQSLAEARPDLPPAFVSLVVDLLRKQPARRPRDAREVSKRISKGIAEMNSGTSVHQAKQQRRSRVRLGVAAATVLVACGLAAGSAAYLRSSHRNASTRFVSPRPPHPHAGAEMTTFGGSPEDAQLTAIAKMVDREVSHAPATVETRRLSDRLFELEQQPAATSAIHLDLVERAFEDPVREIAAVRRTISQLWYPDSSTPWGLPVTDPFEDSSAEVAGMKRQMDDLRQSFHAGH